MSDEDDEGRIFVLAGTYRQYTDWCRRTSRRPSDPGLVPVITCMPDAHFRLCGHTYDASVDRVVKIGTYGAQRYSWSAVQALERMIKRGA